MIVNRMQLRHYTILGKVQGVGYRYFTNEIAISAGLKGWVKNMPDGSVECLVGGEISDLEIFEKKIRKGPPLSRVVNMDRKILDTNEITLPEDFSIQH